VEARPWKKEVFRSNVKKCRRALTVRRRRATSRRRCAIGRKRTDDDVPACDKLADKASVTMRKRCLGDPSFSATAERIATPTPSDGTAIRAQQSAHSNPQNARRAQCLQLHITGMDRDANHEDIVLACEAIFPFHHIHTILIHLARAPHSVPGRRQARIPPVWLGVLPGGIPSLRRHRHSHEERLSR
jgi:hypothetical protein